VALVKTFPTEPQPHWGLDLLMVVVKVEVMLVDLQLLVMSRPLSYMPWMVALAKVLLVGQGLSVEVVLSALSVEVVLSALSMQEPLQDLVLLEVLALSVELLPVSSEQRASWHIQQPRLDSHLSATSPHSAVEEVPRMSVDLWMLLVSSQRRLPPSLHSQSSPTNPSLLSLSEERLMSQFQVSTLRHVGCDTGLLDLSRSWLWSRTTGRSNRYCASAPDVPMLLLSKHCFSSTQVHQAWLQLCHRSRHPHHQV
jgi:hypothetical protein